MLQSMSYFLGNGNLLSQNKNKTIKNYIFPKIRKIEMSRREINCYFLG